MECPFCDPINTQLREFYSDSLFRGVYNLRPLTPGHVLIIPKRHFSSIFELNPQEKIDLVSFVQRCVFLALKYADSNQFDLIQQEGKAAGMSIDHFHMHVIPRKSSDSLAQSKSEWLSEFNKNEIHGRALTLKETKEATTKLKDLAARYKVQLQSF